MASLPRLSGSAQSALCWGGLLRTTPLPVTAGVSIHLASPPPNTRAPRVALFSAASAIPHFCRKREGWRVPDWHLHLVDPRSTLVLQGPQPPAPLMLFRRDRGGKLKTKLRREERRRKRQQSLERRATAEIFKGRRAEDGSLELGDVCIRP